MNSEISGSDPRNAYVARGNNNHNRHTTMASKSGDSIADAIWESANRLADDLDIVAANRLAAWINEHSTSLREAYVQDAITLGVLAIAYFTIAPYNAVIEWTIVMCACFVSVNVVYRTMVNI